MYNYYDNNEVSQTPIRSLQLMHNYNVLPTASHPFMMRADTIRRNSLPKYENPWSHLNNNMKKHQQQQHHHQHYQKLQQQQQQQPMAYDLMAAKKNLVYNYNNININVNNNNLMRMQTMSATPSPVRQLPTVKQKRIYHSNTNNNNNNNNNRNSNSNKNNNNGNDIDDYDDVQQQFNQLGSMQMEKNRIQDRLNSYGIFNQHYQHYYSYFYNNQEDKLALKRQSHQQQQQQQQTLRTLPTRKQTRARFYTSGTMASATTYEFPNAAETPTALSPQKKALDDRHSKLAAVHQKHVLKEKVHNNNVIVTINKNDWLIEPRELPHEHTRVLNLTKNPYGRKNGADEQLKKTKFCYSEDYEETFGNSALLEKEMSKQRAIAKPRFVTARNIAALSNKRNSPNRRVLVYSCPSPRTRRYSSAVLSVARSRVFERQNGGDSLKSNKHANITLKDRLLRGYTEQKATVVDLRDNNNNDDDDVFSDLSDDDASDVNPEDVTAESSDSENDYRTYAFKITNSLMRSSSQQSCLSSQSTESIQTPDTVLAPSLFPHVPPYLAFSSNAKCGPAVPAELHRVLKWRVTNVMPKVVRTILSNSGMRLLKKTNDWMGTWGKHMKSPCFKTLRPYQKLNHLPGSFRIGRKDSCWKNLQKLMSRHSKRDFGFMPKTYIIPQDLPALRKSWPRYSQNDVKWIIKPPASARGAGIRVVNKWNQIPKRRPLIVQKYIERPLLINGSKFDLRMYVLVTSINPLRVFMYHNGLARFASVKYSDKSETLNDRCMHLTNYSINKISNNYLKNEDVNACHGHKWTIKSLWTYLGNRGVRTDLLWDTLRNLVLRTLMAGEGPMNNMIKMNVESKYSVFELFGFDILLDSDLIPWLLEVNISPSLHSELPLDAHVKAPLVQAVLNTALYHVPPKLTLERQKEIAGALSYPTVPFCYDKRLYINYLSREEKMKHANFTRKELDNREEYLNSILENLTPDDVRCLIIAEDELARSSPLERIFPTSQTHKYLKYTQEARYYNRLLDAWETRFGNNRAEGIAVLRRYCEQKYHLEVPTTPAKKLLTSSRTRAMVKTHPVNPINTWNSSRNSRFHRLTAKFPLHATKRKNYFKIAAQNDNKADEEPDKSDSRDDSDDSEASELSTIE